MLHTCDSRNETVWKGADGTCFFCIFVPLLSRLLAYVSFQLYRLQCTVQYVKPSPGMSRKKSNFDQKCLLRSIMKESQKIYYSIITV